MLTVSGFCTMGSSLIGSTFDAIGANTEQRRREKEMTVKRMPACAFLLTICVSLVGCATPDLRPYSEQTASLASAISAEQRAVSTKMAGLVELAESTQKKTYKDKKKAFDEYATAMNALL